jgi:hypothetical protein
LCTGGIEQPQAQRRLDEARPTGPRVAGIGRDGTLERQDGFLKARLGHQLVTEL